MNFTTETKLRLLKDTVIVQVMPEKQYHSIILPDNTRNGIDLIKAKVITIGSKFRHSSDITVGDIVYVPSHFGTVLDLDNPDIKIFDGEDVLAKVE